MIIVREMNETSTTTTSTSPPIASGLVSRMFVRSSTRTRGSSRIRGCSWPWPTSRATTRRAPRCSRQSVKPPVDAPTSRATSPSTSMPNPLRAASSLSPPRPTYRGGGPSTTTASAGADEARRLVGPGAVDEHPPGGDRGLGVGAAGGESPSDELGVEPPTGGHSGRSRRGDLAHTGAADRLLRRGPLRRGLLRRGPLLGRRRASPAPSWRRPSWRRPSWRQPSSPAPSSRGPSWPAPSWLAPARHQGSPGTRSTPAGSRARRPGWPATRTAW